MYLFYSDHSRIFKNKLVLGEEEARHAIRVLRHKTGDIISVTDGEGSLYEAVITNINQQTVTAEIMNIKNYPPDNPQLTLAIGIVKKRDRLEFAIEKCVELGINKILIYRGDHSEKTGVREARIHRIILRAMKQSLRFHLPKAVIKNSLEDALRSEKFTGIIAADETKKRVKTANVNVSGHHLLVIGPEGGYSESERRLLSSFNADKISVGKHRLRTETAAIVMTARYRQLAAS